ncbi:MAG: nucleotide exchange factor GrpE [Oscillospiraceae bacterium]
MTETEPLATPMNEDPAAQAPTPTKKKAPKAKAAAPAGEVAALEEKLAAAQAERDATNDQLLRTVAEYDNFRKRSQKEHDAAFNNGVGHAAFQLLPVLDTLEAAAQAQTTDEEYKKGVLMTLAKCEEIFEKLGIREIDALGQPFDPELHNACMQEACDGAQSGTVTKVMQKGYTQNGRVVRHAVVAVAP